MGILEIGTRALQANQVSLQTTGNNIANVNTPGYSRQRTIQQAVLGQFTGGGYIGKGVAIITIERNYSEFLTRQATLASATTAADTTRATYLRQLGDIFPGGSNGLGASINDMLNSFSDVASAPTDLTARTVTLTRVDESARRMRAASQGLDDLQNNVAQSLTEKIKNINTFAQNIAAINQQVALAKGTGQPPNDLLDRRDQLIRELNTLIQTTTIKADDGTLGVFIGGSQALVLGTESGVLSITEDEFGDPLKKKLAITRGATEITFDENVLGGGEIPGLLRFQNTDLVEGRNLLGRLTLAVTSLMNDQHRLGLDLDGNAGGDLFTAATFGTANVLVPQFPAKLNSVGSGPLQISIDDASRFSASDYEIFFSGATTGTVIRKSDGLQTGFDLSTTPVVGTVTVDGINFTLAGTAAAGDRFLAKPFATAANTVAREFSSPRALAVSNPVAATLTPTNTGAFSLVNVKPLGIATTAAAPLANYSIRFSQDPVTGNTQYDILDAAGVSLIPAPVDFVTGQAISYTDPVLPGNPGFSITLSGSPAVNDTVSIGQNAYAALSGGNASAMMDLRDTATFDGASLTDGYAGLIAQIGIRTQSANYAAEVSSNISANAEKDRSGVSGVNLDEEAANLLKYQQAYQASAKMIQIAQSIFETLLQGLAR